MNSKIKNYVDVLFNDIPKTKKAMELKQEILSNMQDHYDAHIQEGLSENQAYTQAISDIGDIDELLKSIIPSKDVKEKLDKFKITRARNTSISVTMYIISVVFLIGFASIPTVFGVGNEDVLAVIGLIIMLVIIALATGLIVYTHMSTPEDLKPYFVKDSDFESFDDSKSPRMVKQIRSLFWTIILIAYLLISFTTNRWYITWIIWPIGTALNQVITLLYDFFSSNGKNSNNTKIEE